MVMIIMIITSDSRSDDLKNYLIIYMVMIINYLII